MTPVETPTHVVKDGYFSSTNPKKDEAEKTQDEFIDRRDLMLRRYPYDTQRATPSLQSSQTVNVVSTSTRSKSRIIPANISRMFNK